MPADASIYGQVRQPQTYNPLESMAQVMQIQGAMGQNQLAQYGLKKAQRQDDETNALSALLKGGGVDLSTPEGQSSAYAVAPTIAPTFIKNAQESRKLTAETTKANSDAKAKDAEAEGKIIGLYRDASQSLSDPQSAAAFLQTMHTDPRLKDSAIARVPLDQVVGQIPQDPAGFEAWKKSFALGAQKFIELNKPNVQVRNTGGSTDVIATPGLGGPAQVLSSVKNTVSPDAAVQAATSRANNRDTIAKDLQVAGMTPGGGMDDNSERTAQAIASGQLPAPTGMALLNPKNQRILGRVMEINPQYDATTVEAKRKAARDFTSGPQGNAMRSFAVAGDHLDQLGTLVDAMSNGNMQLVNKLSNTFSQQTGNPAVSNFDAAKEIVGKEVVKAIVAGGGGVEERREISSLLDNAKSPAQLKGVITQFRNLMGAQHDALLQQRRAAGLPDSTMPSYTTGGHGASAPGGSKVVDFGSLK